MITSLQWICFFLFVLIVPSLAVGLIRKTKARLQNRRGAPIYQPLIDLCKFFFKGETVSYLSSWIFRSSACVQLACILLIAYLAPWSSLKPFCTGGDLFLIIYLFALIRLVTVLAALDTGSVFGGFGASREVTLAVIVEPAIILCFVSLASVSHTSDLGQVFSFSNQALRYDSPLWLICGTGLFLASIVELSRMPVDDPTTHLELTMVHEAMVLENSGRNLLLVEYGHSLKIIVLLGLAGQCYLHSLPSMWTSSAAVQIIASILCLLLLLFAIALIEATNVKLRWTKIPEFVAYSLVMSIVSVFIAIWRA